MEAEQRMTSLDIAQVTGKMHKDVLKAIRNMEPAWEKECGRKFALTSEKLAMPQGGVLPAYYRHPYRQAPSVLCRINDTHIFLVSDVIYSLFLRLIGKVRD